MTIPETFLLVSALGAIFTLTGLVQGRKAGPLIPLYFFSGWLASELALFHIAWQAAATLFFASRGAFEGTAGWAGLGITLVSWVGLYTLHQRSLLAQRVFDAALAEIRVPAFAEALGEARLTVGEGPTRRDLLLPFQMRRPGIERIRNLSYGDAGKRNLLDIWRPQQREGLCPTLLQIHGGGWCIGNKDQQALPLLNLMPQLGWACVALNYRLSPKATFPDHLIDVKKAIAWIREHGAEYGCDPDLIVVTGGSAGGHLAALAGLTANVARFQPGFEEVDTSVAGCAPYYGIYDFLDRQNFRGAASMEPFLERYVLKCPSSEREKWEDASPFSQIHADAPPFLVIHGTHDTLAFVEDARAFVEELRRQSDAPVAYAELPGAQHAFDNFRSLRAEAAIRAVARFAEAVRVTHPLAAPRVSARS
ncbi:MAG: alpha/beta hydrolase [Deltaproteobacteria bacterium]